MVPIKDLMTSPIISVDAQATVGAAAKLMCEKKISSLLVKEGEEYVGIITKTDLVKKTHCRRPRPENHKRTNCDEQTAYFPGWICSAE